MSEFYDLLEEYIGDADAISEIRTVVRRLYLYDFDGDPLRVWQGKGTLHTEDGNEWFGTIDSANVDKHKTPSIQDGRDGSSPSYRFSMAVPDQERYDLLKDEQWRVAGRSLTCYLAIFKENEALRPTTPIVFFRELTMIQPQFSEKIEQDADGRLTKRYVISVTAKDDNIGRSRVPNRTYTDTMQKFRADTLGVAEDRGCEYVASLANKVLQIP